LGGGGDTDALATEFHLWGVQGGDNGTLLITEEKQGVRLDADIIQRNINAGKGM